MNPESVVEAAAAVHSTNPDTIDAPDFDVVDEVRILALQGDWDLDKKIDALGAKYVITEAARARAHKHCMDFLLRASEQDVHITILPELAIPVGTVPDVLNAIKGMSKSFVFLGGIEGIGRSKYNTLLSELSGIPQGLSKDDTGDYINSILIVVKTPTKLVVRLRAKRVRSRPENDNGLPMAHGAGPFIGIRLGKKPITVVPLICSEFVWPEKLWTYLHDEIKYKIDLVPVLQHNDDASARHTGAALYNAYTSGDLANTRFIFVNQAKSTSCDGTCYVIAPPTTPHAPKFDHSLNELWALPGIATYRGFRIPDLTGCIWWAKVVTIHAPASALANRVCEGMVSEVLIPSAAKLRGVILGLMRSAAFSVNEDLQKQPQTGPRDAAIAALERDKPTYLLSDLQTASANEVFFQMGAAESAAWDTVDAVVRDLVEAAALLGSAGDSVLLRPMGTGNCKVGERPLLILYAPDVDEAFEKPFSSAASLQADPLPEAIVLVGVTSFATNVDAKCVGDVRRADRITTASAALEDSPKKVEDTSATIRPDDLEFRVLQELRGTTKRSSLTLARARLQELLPKVYG